MPALAAVTASEKFTVTVLNDSEPLTFVRVGATVSGVTVNAASGSYTFTGPTAGDKLTGSSAVNKSNAGSLAITSVNDYVGGTNVSGGTLSIDGAGRLGSGGVTISQGQIDSAIAQYIAQAGSQKAVDQSLATNGLAPSQLPSIVRINLQAQAIAKKLAPQGSAQ